MKVKPWQAEATLHQACVMDSLQRQMPIALNELRIRSHSSAKCLDIPQRSGRCAIADFTALLHIDRTDAHR